MKKTYRKPNIYKISLGSECLVPVILSKQSIGENVKDIGGMGYVGDEADAKASQRIFWDL